jgi:hypothetical protein
MSEPRITKLTETMPTNKEKIPKPSNFSLSKKKEKSTTKTDYKLPAMLTIDTLN